MLAPVLNRPAALAALLATHADTLQALLPAHLWPVRPFKTKKFGPLTKYTLGPDGDEWLHLHHAIRPDSGPPHDHPCDMFSTRIKGSYWERIWTDGLPCDILRSEGSAHLIEAGCVHLLTELPQGEVWTLVRTGPVVRKWRHYPGLV